jgi:uncharacterized protein (TIGR00297 family)
VTQALLGVALAAVVAVTAHRARALSTSGAVAAFAVGAVVFGAAGWRGAAVLLAFFIPSALLSRRGAGGAPRNGWQVLANGGVAACCALLATRFGAPLSAALAGAFAAACADTWGTEIGTRVGKTPVSILTLRPVAVGRSGGITLWGSLATVTGSLCVALVAAVAGVGPLLGVATGGIAGAALDSLLGASLQAMRYCPACDRECETRRHECGAATQLRRGLNWMENDAVNFAATLCGAAVAGFFVR